ncbi:response regulator transcription factor [Amycolatopsis roodepoortensis]|uniref:response regulator transcription factor n=1 Tax=Amycolatopsis roodepoortensis TaxID=700274 RepID=UPI00214CE0D7|nr:response regulator transcription factor [Amycolatopsis roodepoortensis]UUV31552.1 response regulator transcription factor [Amycolatopsis roodepoortensis]
MIHAPELYQAETLNVGLAIRSEVTRYGLERLLGLLPSIGNLSTFNSPGSVLGTLEERHETDVLIIALCDISDEQIRDSCIPSRERCVKILLLLDSSSEQDMTRSTGVSCDGFLDIGNLTAPGIHDALHRVCKGEVPMPAALTKNLLAQARNGSTMTRNGTPVSLTPREQQVLSLMVDGLSNKQIARTLTISLHGAKRLVANVLAKLNCSNRTLAVSRALREGLLPSKADRADS